MFSEILSHHNVFFQPPIGFSIATSIRVGNELGAGNPNAAKRASYLAIVCVCKYASNVVISTFNPSLLFFLNSDPCCVLYHIATYNQRLHRSSLCSWK